MDWFSILPALAISIIAWVIFKQSRNRSGTGSAHSLPPGPPADPVIGHLRIFPSIDNQAEVFHDWAKTYGDVIYLNILGQRLVVLDSIDAAVDLLDKRRPKYSNRPESAVFTLMGLNRTLILLQYGKVFNLHRKLFQSYFGAKECRDLVPIQVQGAHLLVRNLLAKPQDYINSLESFSTSLILRIAYGYEIKGDYKDDPVVGVINTLVDIAKQSSIALTALDFLPWLKYFPGWFPGGYWAAFARKNKHTTDIFYDYPFDIVQKEMKAGTAKASFTSTHLSHVDPDMDDKDSFIDAIKLTAAQIYAAGAETTSSTLAVFLMAMVLFPDVQEKAQVEIDKVVGSGRLPTFEDRPDLPCIDYILHEVARWFPIVPLSVPHVSSEDDIYRGMFIPKGSLIFANIRSMGINTDVYKDPDTFNPYRYRPQDQGGNGEPLFSASFGFGARICPGRFMAENSLWIAIATILATCKINKEKDEQGNDVTPKLEFFSGTTRQLKPFSFEMVARSSKALELMEQTQLH